MICLSCGCAFEHPVVLGDGLGSLIRVCPNCKSADIAIFDKADVKAGKEAPHD